MNLLDFTERNLSPIKTKRILVYPNITYSKDLEKDSFIQVIKNMVYELNKIRNDLYFYIIVPQFLSCLDFPNVSQFFMDFPTYPPVMRSHFDVQELKKIVSHDLDIDLVFTHLPEHTHAITNTLYNVTHHTPSIFGYCHWFDLREVVAWNKDSFLQNICGILEMDRCYLNTQYQKDMVLRQASETFNSDTVDRLDKIMTVQYLGVRKDDVIPSVNKNTQKTIVFNHRPDTYKDFPNFMKLMYNLRKERQDFEVWIPLLDKSEESWISTQKFDKNGYYKKLQECRVGFSPKQKYGGWSVSTTDGMMNGCPFIMFDSDYYKELNPNADYFKNNDSALELLNRYLDDVGYRNIKASECLNYCRSNLLYEKQISNMSSYINLLIEKNKKMDSDVVKKIINTVKEHKQITKRELFYNHLGWGRGIKFTPYRRALMSHPNVFDVMDKYPTYLWIE